MKKTVLFGALTAASLLLSGNVLAKGDAAAGKAKSAMCIACHGPAGVAPAGTPYPSIACQKDVYLVKQMKAFKTGTRVDSLMKPMVAALSDVDMENIAAYYAVMTKCK